jgi:hypothetical protein
VTTGRLNKAHRATHDKAIVMADTEKADLIMESITVTLKKKDKQGIKKVLINEMFATCKGGHVTALMGPSGVGDVLFKLKARFFRKYNTFVELTSVPCSMQRCNTRAHARQ